MSNPTDDLTAEVRRVFDVASQCVMLSVMDLKPGSATARLSETTNPIIWEVGHLAYHQEYSLHRTNGGAGVLTDRIVRMFCWGSNPQDDLPDYPPLAEVMDAYVRVTAASKAILDDATPEEWAAPRTAPDGKPVSGGETLLQLVRRMSLHHIYHVGCITALRKELGDKCPRGFIPGMSDEAISKQQARFDTFWQTHRNDYC